MKVFVTLSMLLALTLAEPPRYRQQSDAGVDPAYYYFGQQPKAAFDAPYTASGSTPDGSSFDPAQRQQQQPSSTLDVVDDTAYPPSGWRPDGPAFHPGQRQQPTDVEPIASYRQQYNAPKPAPQKQYGAPSAPQQQYGAPSAPQQQYGGPSAPQQQYGAASTAQQQYAAPPAPQQQYGGPVTPQRQRAASAPAQKQYGAPAAPQQQYGAPAASQQQYGAPAAPQQQQYSPSAAPQQQQYSAPASTQQQYGAPAASQQYGAPAASQGPNGQRNGVTTTEEATSTEFDESTTLPGDIESQAEAVDSVNEFDDDVDVDAAQQKTNSEYYVAFPDGRLQRVRSMSAKDIATMKYYAKITAENVEPLRGPLYAYTPPQRLQFAPASLQPALTSTLVASQNLPLVQQSQVNQPLAAPISSSFPNYQLSSNDPTYVITF